MQRARIAARVDVASAIVGPLVFAVMIATAGVPALRHDWWWPAHGTGLTDALTGSASGWLPNGIGYPNLYVTNYLVGGLRAVLGWALGSARWLVVSYCAIVASVITFGARALAARLGASVTARVALIVFALFDPFVYTELVAGHLELLLSYGVCLFVLAELLRSQPSDLRLAALAIGTMEQVQLFLVVLAILFVRALRGAPLPLAAALVAYAPCAIGLIFERSFLATIPYQLDWQRSQSVWPGSAISLSGYFTEYTASFAGWPVAGIDAVAACAVAGLWLGRRRSEVRSLGLGCVALLLVVMGTHGPLGGAYLWSVSHVRATAVFRELYDLEALVAVAYIALAASAAATASVRTVVTGVLAAGVLASLLPWIVDPPQHRWIDAASLPTVTISAPPNTRFALLPSFQPFGTRRGGSGPDPDDALRPDDRTPLNAYQSSYPADAALAWLERCRSGPSDALSVAAVAARPWLRSQAEGDAANGRGPACVYRPRPIPELSLLPADVELAGLPIDTGAGVLFYGDVSRSGRGAFVPIVAGIETIDPTIGWIDARLEFVRRPWIAQATGGVFTTSRLPLSVAGAQNVLAAVHGRLSTVRGDVVSVSSRLAWSRVPRGASELVCRGSCVVVATGRVPGGTPPVRERRAGRELAFDAIAPWFVLFDVPPGPAQELRYNVAFDERWTAFAVLGRPLEHERLDAAVNGWRLEPRAHAERVVVLEWVAFLQAFAEIGGAAVTAALVVAALRPRRSRSIAFGIVQKPQKPPLDRVDVEVKL